MSPLIQAGQRQLAARAHFVFHRYAGYVLLLILLVKTWQRSFHCGGVLAFRYYGGVHGVDVDVDVDVDVVVAAAVASAVAAAAVDGVDGFVGEGRHCHTDHGYHTAAGTADAVDTAGVVGAAGVAHVAYEDHLVHMAKVPLLGK